MSCNLILEIIRAAFKLEISNYFEVENNKVKVAFEDGTNAIITIE